jgi:hypothetical protein
MFMLTFTLVALVNKWRHFNVHNLLAPTIDGVL